MATLKFADGGEEVGFLSGQELSALENEIPIKFGCRKGCCGVCAIEVLDGEQHITKMSAQERDTLGRKGLGPNHRLACQCALNGSITCIPKNRKDLSYTIDPSSCSK